MHKKLFIPGPTEVAPEVLAKMATPMIGHRSKDASNLQREISEKLRQVFHTKNPILLSTTSGSGLMEGSIRSLTAKRAMVFSVGAFGNRWYKMAEANGVPADKVESEWGHPTTPEMVDKALATGKYDVFTVTHNETSTGIMNPVEEIAEVRKKYPDVLWLVDAVSSMAGAKIEVDKLGIDVCITSTQKALALPPGMAICSVTPRALEHGKQVKTPRVVSRPAGDLQVRRDQRLPVLGNSVAFAHVRHELPARPDPGRRTGEPLRPAQGDGRMRARVGKEELRALSRKRNTLPSR